MNDRSNWAMTVSFSDLSVMLTDWNERKPNLWFYESILYLLMDTVTKEKHLINKYAFEYIWSLMLFEFVFDQMYFIENNITAIVSRIRSSLLHSVSFNMIEVQFKLFIVLSKNR